MPDTVRVTIEAKNPLRRAIDGEERLWRVWWKWGIPVAVAANILTLFAEMAFMADYDTLGNATDVLKFLIYIAWFQMAWRCSKNTDNPAWTVFTRLAVALGFGVAAITL